jgi:hypothetical protein
MLEDLFKKVTSFLRGSEGTEGGALIFFTVVFIMGGHGFFWVTVDFLDNWTHDWYTQRHPSETLVALTCSAEVAEHICGRLGEHLILAQHRALHHYEISREFQTYQFGFLSTAFGAGTMLALGFIAVARKGFDDLGSAGKGMLLGLLCTAAFFGGFPALVSIDQNVESNLEAYNAYDGVSNEIRSYMSSGQSVTGNHVDGPSFLHKVDLMLSDLDAPRIQFDAAQVDLGKSRFLELSNEMEAGVAASPPAPPSAPPAAD